MQTVNNGEIIDPKWNQLSQITLNTTVNAATEAILAQQQSDGHWRYDLEGHVVPTALYVLTLYYVGEVLDPDLNSKLGNYLRRTQVASGGWGLVPDADMDLNASVVTYFALRLIGDDADDEHMRRASRAIVQNGGIEETNFNGRNYLALFGIIPWSCVPSVPVQVMLLPSWFPFTLYKIGFWARTTMVPITIVQALKRPARSKAKLTLDELFCRSPTEIGFPKRSSDKSKVWFYAFKAADRFIKLITPLIPTGIHEKAMKTALEFCIERLNGIHGFGSIYPAIEYLLMALDALEYPPEHPDRMLCREALNTLEIVRQDEVTISTGLSPVWDTAHVVDALLEVGEAKAIKAAEKGLELLRSVQIRDFKGDWAHNRPNTEPGGWAFFYRNAHYPDTDDTAYVLSGLHRMSRRNGCYSADQDAIAAGKNWLLGMQCQNGGWASYDADNTYTYLDNIPAADEDSLIDPPTVDVTSNVMLFLAQTGLKFSNSEIIRRAVGFVLPLQKENGSWWGRWGVAYIYGTKYVILALIKVGLPKDHPSIRRGVAWLLSIQNEDGGWGESTDS